MEHPNDLAAPAQADRPGLLVRVALAFAAFWRVLVDARAANQVRSALRGPEGAAPAPEGLPEASSEPSPEGARAAPPSAHETARGRAAAVSSEEAVLHFLGALQREGRFVDFIAEDLPPSVPDADIGAAARMVHRGCRKALDAWVHIEPVLPGDEGAPATVPEGFDARAVTLTGNVQGAPPFHGTLAHHGWRATDVRLPLLSGAADPSVLAPAEVEL